MKEQELRIGNYVKTVFDDTLVVCGILGDNSVLLQEDGAPEIYGITQLDPIPITPEILREAGFEQEYDEHSKQINDYKIVVTIARKEVDIYEEGKPMIASCGVHDFVFHKLQNLVYDLIGEELPLKIK